MLHGLGVTCLDRFLGRFFSQFVRTRMGMVGIDTFSRACSFPGSFRPCAGPQGVNYALWPWCHLFGPLFGPHFFTICVDSFRPCAAPQGELCSMASVSPVWTAFWAAFFHNLCGQFPAWCRPGGCELCSMASVSPVSTAFWAVFFHNL